MTDTSKPIKPYGEVTEADIREATYPTLRAWSIEAGFGAAGKSHTLRHRLITDKRPGTTKTHTNGRTDCQVCGSPALVKKKVEEEMDDGRTLITRSMRCTGKHRHSYPLKEIVDRR